MLKGIFWVFVGLLVIGAVSNAIDNANQAARQSKQSRSSAAASGPSGLMPVSSGASRPVAAPVQTSAWSYTEQPDKMGRGGVKNATTQSTNSVRFDFPYHGVQYATLHLRKHPKYGNDVILYLDRAQFNCGIDDCSVQVRFDDGKVQQFPAVEPEDHSTNTLFIRGFDRFVSQARKAKRIQIEATFFQQGSHVFEFDSAGLKF